MDKLTKFINKRNSILAALLILLITVVIFTKGYVQQYTSDFIDHRIYSTVLNENRKIFVRLPKNYDKNKHYPLIIKSDGNFNLARWHDSISALSEQGIIEESIVVAIPNLYFHNTRNRDLVPPYARQDVQITARPKTLRILGNKAFLPTFLRNKAL